MKLRFLSALTVLGILAFLESATFENHQKTPGYDLNSPDFSLVLPDTLREVSGVVCIDSATFACVQDENGIVFIYDFLKNQIKKQYSFNIDGDYEGITRIDKTLYVLRSDGMLYEISDYESPDFKLTSYATGVPARNNEGLCYDADHHRLLIASKGKIGKGPEYKDKRMIYGFDLNTKTLISEPVFDFNLQEIKQFAQKNNIKLPTRTKKHGEEAVAEPVLKFATSAICIHPITKKLYLLSAADHLLFIFDVGGNIEHLEVLNPVKFNKTEGITFLENGDMLVTNEAQDKKPTVLRFNYK
ncbi:MAG: hypothetical protein A3D31_04650 [Candidatus Fluviicola riflensis]|nr:MAG: hypothetical protein CHH17_10370 [Candidatus Fluviicola riflensis]OGS79265.1 MAG: hypothetical protein A3D31_04650 [Candidatus Fluviicola riflensis]OGS86697.1 MAG: hypothetical protein A2724_04110 [Fluviicola sp. RIFCSPHIGHO2_01_FULL_43_53]OGS88829.1 MAG: hypothetical protein A3E30_00550 [Fluviicola sp. RIFCSPHIGHO2_12_FULL_43_24]